MTPEEERNVAVVRKFFELMDVRDRAGQAALFVTNSQRHFPAGTYSDAIAAQNPVTSFRTVLDHVFGSGDMVAARLTHYVTYASHIPHYPRWGPVAAAGKSVSWVAHAHFRLEDGKIAERWVARDELGVLQQLGAIPRGE